MTVKIGNIGKFTLFPAGTKLVLPGEEKRRVRLEVNCEYETRLDAILPQGETVFLAKVDGLKAVEFVVDGPAEIVATSEGEVWLSTDEGRHITFETDEPSFVTLDFERQPELSEFERMQAIANLKREQREAEARELLDAKLAELQGKIDATPAPAPQPADASGGGGGTAPAGTSSEPVTTGTGADEPAGSSTAVSAG